MDLEKMLDKAIKRYSKETKELEFLPKSRFNKNLFPSIGQYDWFSGELLYCLLRYKKPKKIVEISTSSGYSTLFMAMALKKNKQGKIYTFEIDENNQKAARENFKRFEVDDFVESIKGDAKKQIKKIKNLNKADILFLDSEHTADFARWFIKELVMKNTQKESLFHIHDVMPPQARVRKFGGPPWGVTTIHFYRKIIWKLLHIIAGNPVEEEKIVIQKGEGKKLSTYNGNEGTEAVFANKLTAKISPKEYVYLYDIADKYKKTLSSRKYDKFSVGHQDQYGNPFEWNCAMWAYANSIKKAIKLV